MKTVLTPIDFSEITDVVIAQASTLARVFDGRVVLMNVTQPPRIAAEYSGFADTIAQINSIAAKFAMDRLAELEDALEAGFTKTDSIQLTGSPVALIIEQAKKLPADYIVIGSHGHTAFYDLLVGSTASGVLRRAPCPVLVVPAPKKSRHPRSQAESEPSLAPPVDGSSRPAGETLRHRL